MRATPHMQTHSSSVRKQNTFRDLNDMLTIALQVLVKDQYSVECQIKGCYVFDMKLKEHVLVELCEFTNNGLTLRLALRRIQRLS